MKAFTTLTSTEIRRNIHRVGGKHDPSQTLIHDRAIFAQNITLPFARNEVYTRFRFIFFFAFGFVFCHSAFFSHDPLFFLFNNKLNLFFCFLGIKFYIDYIRILLQVLCLI